MPFENLAAALIFMGPLEMLQLRQSWHRVVSREMCVWICLSDCTPAFGQSAVRVRGSPRLGSLLCPRS